MAAEASSFLAATGVAGNEPAAAEQRNGGGLTTRGACSKCQRYKRASEFVNIDEEASRRNESPSTMSLAA
jgi:hypothetical protein